jgi:hypothetical protein
MNEQIEVGDGVSLTAIAHPDINPDSLETVEIEIEGTPSPQPNEKAFPSEDYFDNYGMDLRDYFAAKAMQGDWASNDAELSEEYLAKVARTYYRMADAMMEARKEASNEIKE